jgi:hypothetical protein
MIAQILIAPNIGGCILGAFLTGIVTLVAYEASKKEWITLTAALAMSISCILIGFFTGLDYCDNVSRRDHLSGV